MRDCCDRWWPTVALCLAVWCMVPPGARAAEAANPVTNGGFEVLAPDGSAKDWEFVGSIVAVTDQAHTGRWALRFERPRDATAETGLNRSWKQDSGQQGRMLAQLRGGIRFWYQAIRSEGCRMLVQLIPMSQRPLEDTGEPRATFTVPPDHVGDGQWHEGVLRFDFTGAPKVKWLHVGVRLIGGPGEMLFDDVRYVEKVGPALSVGNIRVDEEPGRRPGEACILSATVSNLGDEAMGAASVSIELPDGLQTEKPAQTTGPLPVDGEEVVSWRVSGARVAGTVVRITASSGKVRDSRMLRLEPLLKLRWLLADGFLLAPGEATRLRCVLENQGTASASGVTCRLSIQGGLVLKGDAEQAAPDIPPSGSREIVWEATAGADSGEALANLEVTDPGGFRASASSSLDITPAVKAAAEPLAGAVWIHKAGDRVVGDIRTSDSTSSLAWMPSLARVVYLGADGAPKPVSARADEVARKGDAAVVISKVRDADSGLWTFQVSVAPAGDWLTSVDCQVECDRPRKVLAFEGPVLYVGEGTSGSAKTDAIFPGLEWLEGEEYSSSSLDIREDHPDRIRYAPHPRKVTIPCMGVHNAAGTIGLLWDVHQKWDGTSDQPQPIFACPDRFEGRGSILLGLMAPNVATGLKENQRLATSRPVTLPAKTPVRLQGLIYCNPKAGDSLAVVDAWFARFHAAGPLVPPQGDYVKQVEFSMRAYTESLYLAEEKTWLPYLGGPGIWRKPRHNPGFCLDLLMAARITKDAALAARYRELAEAQAKLAKSRPFGDDLGFEFAHPVASLLGHASVASGLVDSQGKDGAWRFNARHKDTGVFKGLDYHALGPDNAFELGTTARRAYEVLRYARLVGDIEAYRAGALALEAMTRFKVPRAAQVWEVPVHTPDILAAADAIDAYLEGYRFSKDPKWLAEARRWARAGLPFIYVWRVPEHPWMLYGSVPVFGASWFDGSWFGHPVQWNGLRYAYALLKLAEFDPPDDGGRRGYAWRTIATGITHSAMYQQSAAGKNVALWPDSFHTITGRRAPWDFAPAQILKNVFHLIGREIEPQTVLLAEGQAFAGGPACAADRLKDEPRLAIDSGAVILAASWKATRLEMRLRYPPGEQGYSLVVGTAKPSKVTLDGVEMIERGNLEEQTESGWRYDQPYNIVVVRVAREGVATLVLEGVRPHFRPMMARLVRDINFDFERHSDGWVGVHDLTEMQVKDGKLTAEIRGPDPYMVRRRCDIDGNAVRTIRLRMLLTAGQTGEFYWATQASPQTDEQKAVRFPVTADGQWHEYSVPVGAHPRWQGQRITEIRIDPGTGASSGHVEIDWVRGAGG